MEMDSHVEGRNAKVRLFPDRLVWTREALFSNRADTNMILLRQVANVSSFRDGMLFDRVDVATSAGASQVSFRVVRDEGKAFVDALLAAMRALDARPAHAPGPAPAAPAAAQVDPTAAKIHQLAELHARGVLTDEEFTAAKRKALGLD